MNWEKALEVFAAKEQGKAIVPREKVAGPGTNWYKGEGELKVYSEGGWGAPWGADVYKDKPPAYDIWWHTDYTFDDPVREQSFNLSARAGVNVDWDLTRDGSPLYTFINDALTVLNPVLFPPNQNDTTAPPSFVVARDAARDLDDWLIGWRQRIKGWADRINAPGEDWQGSAAGVFKAFLTSFSHELEYVHLQVDPARMAEKLDKSREALTAATKTLYDSRNAWVESGKPFFVQTLGDLFGEVMKDAKVTWTFTGEERDKHSYTPHSTFTVSLAVATPFGDPKTQAFWTALQTEAKTRWLTAVAEMLDRPAGPAMAALSTAYADTTAVIPAAILPPTLKLPPVKAPEPPK
ncbi:hypothetical protein, partial [Streptomyces sp. WAC06614]|uniref:hypothetical protein n=1 Tax=Streptomyces sp. WAC06614 TaxID=2487416 RepID=UPI000F9085B3